MGSSSELASRAGSICRTTEGQKLCPLPSPRLDKRISRILAAASQGHYGARWVPGASDSQRRKKHRRIRRRDRLTLGCDSFTAVRSGRVQQGDRKMCGGKEMRVGWMEYSQGGKLSVYSVEVKHQRRESTPSGGSNAYKEDTSINRRAGMRKRTIGLMGQARETHPRRKGRTGTRATGPVLTIVLNISVCLGRNFPL